MANAAIAFENLSDEATVTVSSAAALMGASYLVESHVARKWRTTGVSGSIHIDLLAATDVDTFALIGCNLTATGTVRVMTSLTDPTGVGGPFEYDTGAVAGVVDPDYGYAIVLRSTPVSARYVHIELTDAALTYVEAGRMFVGARTQLGINFAPGWQRGYTDRSRRTESRNGQIFIDRNNMHRNFELTFNGLSESEALGVMQDLDRLNGEHLDILMITDPDSTNLGRDSIWGLVELQPLIQPYSVAEHFSKKIQIRERQ